MALKLEILLEAVDRLTGPLNRVQARLAAVAAPVRAIGEATARLGRAAGLDRVAAGIGRIATGARQAAGALLALTSRLGAVVGIGGAVGAVAIGRSALAGASAIERYRITLTQVEGSAAAAERALAWVNDFATRTPFELDEVTRAFVNIRNLGLDPTRGALAAAGDAAAIMGTRFDEAVTAMSAALRGEMDPIERFGIFARTEGNNIVMRWEHQGRRMRAVVDKNNREMLARMIQAAWAQKFGGGMDQLSRSWAGMMSNLSDAWSRFQQMVMRAGVFDWMRSRLAGLLAAVNRMAADGTLQRWANTVAASLIRAFTAIEDFVLGRQRLLNLADAADGGGLASVRENGLLERLSRALRQAADAFAWLQRNLEPIIGPFDALDAALAGLVLVLGGPLLGGLTTLAGGILTLAAVLIGTKLGLALLALAALAAAGRKLYQSWDGIAEFFRGVGQGIADGLQVAIDAIERLLSLLPRLPGSATGPAGDADAQRRRRQNMGRRGENRGYYGPSLDDLPDRMSGDGPGGAAAAPRVDTGGTLRITIEDGRVTARGRMNDPGTRVDIDQGLMLGAP